MVYTFFDFPREIRDQIYDLLLEDMLANGLSRTNPEEETEDFIRASGSKTLYIDDRSV